MEPFDLVIVGGGIAGLAAALSAPSGARIVVVDKGEAGAGSSPLAQGGLAAAVGPDDGPDLHAADTIRAGAGICDEDLVGDVCSEGPATVDWLLSLGCTFERDSAGALDLAREASQSVARSVHWRDATGAEIVRALRAAVRGRDVLRVEERAAGLIMRDGRSVGVATPAGAFVGRIVLLATGGAGALWGTTTNAPGATGDGIALALVAGARVADLEFMQFHPTALDDGTKQRVLLTEALRGEGALLLAATGERFVDELAPRNVVTKAIVERGGRAFLDCRTIPHLEERFPTIVAGARSRGFEPTSEPLPVSPAAHYFIGGIAADAQGRTSLPGLFAAGECASTGMHGANRMAGNSLLETVVVGRRVGAGVTDESLPPPNAVRGLEDPLYTLPQRIPALMWDHVGPVRDEAGLRKAISTLSDLSMPPSPTVNLCLSIAHAALARVESRGVHLRSDFPDENPELAARSFDQMRQTKAP